MIVSAQLQQPRVKVDLVATALQHGTAEIVTARHSRNQDGELKLAAAR